MLPSFVFRPAALFALILMTAALATIGGCTAGKSELEASPIPVADSSDTEVSDEPARAELTSAVELAAAVEPATQSDDAPRGQKQPEEKLEIATFGSGCFWCVEAVFEQLKGVKDVESGYSGGQVKNPTYKEVCTGETGHAEVVQIKFDPKQISYQELLDVFWKTHDPTTLNRQGHDEGTQYRSAVFYHSKEQKEVAEFVKKKLDESKVFSDPIVTEITAASKFYPAEIDHQDYYRLNGRAPYCRAVIRPKLDKVKKSFADKLIKID
jgi:peptide-methionine (S)-S-oxide reductase